MCRNVATQEAYIPGFLCTDIFRVYAEIFIFGEIYTPDSMSSVGRNSDVNLLSWPPRISVPAGKTTTEWKYWSSMSWTKLHIWQIVSTNLVKDFYCNWVKGVQDRDQQDFVLWQGVIHLHLTQSQWLTKQDRIPRDSLYFFYALTFVNSKSTSSGES